eukprot:CAMPEP_0178932502 /NCGR_PEP_ID=MMETSP0786-20121207/22653_1 /TAXON_ID=186022 /ORGANISM="Thalassionema frauenfeldii, Strain CCMP 1798" /LENGTH=71 /DNA_ID=CAMNT_0020609801 /DNA_START=52 /DNA_END=267 /DNA_ORIENTATION=+
MATDEENFESFDGRNGCTRDRLATLHSVDLRRDDDGIQSSEQDARRRRHRVEARSSRDRSQLPSNDDIAWV